MASDRGQQLSRVPKLRSGHPRQERGAALLTAILIVAIATILATNLLWLATLDQRRTASAIATDQGLLYAQGAEAWVGDILRQDLEDSPDYDHLGELWASEIPPLPIDGGFITGQIEDMQGRFNLNNLVTPRGEEDPLMVAQFERLLMLVDIDPQVAGAVVDWLDPDVEPRFPYGGEDAAYSNTNPQYRTANSMMTSTSELMAISGFDRESYDRIRPFVATLPRGTRLNVNTASAVVLASLSDELTLPMAESLVNDRGLAEFASVQTTFQGLVSEEMLPRIDGVSEHFMLTGTVTIGDTALTMRSLLQRNNSGITRLLFRSFGVE
jgi:general secretion pathway protein K